jgi:diketogulonate reductase-like aldo/keto reductase
MPVGQRPWERKGFPRAPVRPTDPDMATQTLRATTLPSGEPIPVLGQGTWHMAEDASRARDEIAALRLGIELGMTVIDTAEMYADGRAEELVAKAVADRRGDVFLVSKVLPHHATHRGTIAACAASLRRLGTDHIDLYLLHWRGSVPLRETLAGFRDLVEAGAIRYWGVSNFDVTDMAELFTLPGGDGAATDQVLYNLAHRGIEWDLMEWCRTRSLPVMAYSPIDQGRLLAHPAVLEVAERHHATPAQVALAWVLDHEGVVAIPRAGSPEHVEENRGALDLELGAHDHAELSRAFPPPSGPRPLEMT